MKGYTIDGQPVNSAFYMGVLNRLSRPVRHCVRERYLKNPMVERWVYDYSDGTTETVTTRGLRECS